jgi:hypothetical protein
MLTEELRLTPAGAFALRLTLRYIAPIGIAVAALGGMIV